MTTNSTTAKDCLAKLGIHLPDAPTPFGAYVHVPAVQTGNLLFLSGMRANSAIATMKVALAKLGGIKAWSLLSFIGGVAVTLGFSNISGSKNSQHVYELRLYHVNEGKIDALIARFGDHTDAIFRRHNMKSIGFWRPEDAPLSQNLFVYILEHPSRDEARKNWAAFQADPEWKKVKADSETNGALANHIDSYFMDPTSFSAHK
jgi:hypothetical protein